MAKKSALWYYLVAYAPYMKFIEQIQAFLPTHIIIFRISSDKWQKSYEESVFSFFIIGEILGVSSIFENWVFL